MALLQQWRDMAYDQKADKGKLQRFWAAYFEKEKEIYAQLLRNPDEVVEGTVKELAERAGVKYTTLVETTTGRCAGHQLIPTVRKFMQDYTERKGMGA